MGISAILNREEKRGVFVHNLNDWYLFCKVAEEKSITRASQKLNIPTATISRRISNLEETVACLLFNRTPSKLSLTDEGLIYYLELKDILFNVEQELNQISDDLIGVKGFIKVMIPRLIYKFVFQQAFEQFLQQYPNIHVEISLYDDKYQEVSADFDLVISVNKESKQFFDTQKIAEHHLILVATKEFINEHPPITMPDDLHHVPFISRELILDRYQLLNRSSQEQIDISFTNKRLNISDAFAIKRSALSGIGFAVLPHILVKDELQNGELIRILPDWYLQASNINLLTKKQEITPKSHQLLIGVMLEAVERFKSIYREQELIS